MRICCPTKWNKKRKEEVTNDQYFIQSRMKKKKTKNRKNRKRKQQNNVQVFRYHSAYLYFGCKRMKNENKMFVNIVVKVEKFTLTSSTLSIVLLKRNKFITKKMKNIFFVFLFFVSCRYFEICTVFIFHFYLLNSLLYHILCGSDVTT